MAAESSQGATSSSRSGWKYDVFLSFRGETRLGFTDHLYSALHSKGLIVFRDEEKLERGKNIRPTLWKAIQESEYKVIVISKDYASSTWCLDELIEIVKSKGEKVLPVFYDVDPSHVRKQTDSFATAFAKHTEKKVDEEQMNMWRNALKEVCDLTGWDVRGRHESEVVEDICSKIFSGLSWPLLDINDDLVGIESQIKELMTLLHVREEDEDVRYIGIWGMGGVGKTTLAEVIYNRVSYRFDSKCFISNVREKSGDLICLQQQLISHILCEEESLIRKKICTIFEGQRTIARMFQNKKVFIVLDNVDKEDQLEALARKPDWFGKGSRILVTSRNSQVLKRHVNENRIYEVKGLSYPDALQLFLLKAFNKPSCEKSYMDLAKDIVKYARGLPLALKIFGLFLFDSPIEAWKCALDRLKADPGSNILDRLQISFEGLEDLQKKLFLDIACFYKGKCVHNITDKLKALSHFPEIDIPKLESKSLLKISSNNVLEMHDLLQEMGHQIVRLESLNEPGKRSRLWYYKDIIHVLNYNTGTDAVEAIFLELPLPKQMKLNFEGFSKMKKLRMLMICPKNFDEYWIGEKETFECLSTVKWKGKLSKFMISNKLCVLEWWGYPLKKLPTNFELENLIEFKMPMSNIIKLWDATKNFEKLKYINLKDSPKLVEIPDLREIPNLEELDIRGTAVKQLSSSTEIMEKFHDLRIGGSLLRPVTFLPHNLPSSLRFLRDLYLNYCNLLDVTFLNDISCSSSLKVLDLSGNNFTQMASISQLWKLQELILIDCTELISLPPRLPASLKKIDVEDCPLLTPFSDPKDLLTFREMLVGGDIAVKALFFGSNSKRDGTWHVGQLCINDDDSYIEATISWGPALTSNIPKWFNQKGTSLPDISGTFRFDFNVNVHLLLEPCRFNFDSHLYTDSDCDSDWDMVSDLDLVATNFYDENPLSPREGKIFRQYEVTREIYSCWGYALFIVYEVVEVNSCERNCSSTTTFPVFVCELEVNNEDHQKVPKKCRGTSPKVPLTFRVPEIPSVGRNGIWVFLDHGCFADITKEMFWHYIGSCSITISSPSPNVEVKECGGRLVLKHDRSEFYEIVRSLSTHGSECYDAVESISPNFGPQFFPFHNVKVFAFQERREPVLGKRDRIEERHAMRRRWKTRLRRLNYWTRESLAWKSELEQRERERLRRKWERQQRKRQARKAEIGVEICEEREEDGVKICEESEEEEGVEIYEEGEKEFVEICEKWNEEGGVEICEDEKEEGIEICEKGKRKKELNSVKKGERKKGRGVGGIVIDDTQPIQAQPISAFCRNNWTNNTLVASEVPSTSTSSNLSGPVAMMVDRMDTSTEPVNDKGEAVVSTTTETKKPNRLIIGETPEGLLCLVELPSSQEESW